MFNCPMARYCWCLLRDCFSVESIPRSRDEFIELFLRAPSNHNNSTVWFWFAALSWALWLTRNDRVFKFKVLMNPSSPLYRALSSMQQWRPLMVAKRLQAADEVTVKIARVLQEANKASSVRAGVG